MYSVILLNADWSPLGIINWKKAVKLMVKGKVEVIKASTKIITNFEKTIEITIPEIIRLVKFIRALWKIRVPFNKRNVLVRDNFTCAYCGKKMNSGLSIDHVLPKSKGGESTFDNTVACCVKCNNVKDNKDCQTAKMYPRVKPYIPTINQFLMLQIKNAGLGATLKEYGII
jgi:5-methylcytosine-specific restriction endonuclease McrA